MDDLHVPPAGWSWAKTSDDAIEGLRTRSVSVLSLDRPRR
ncbi:cyclic-phosphate processing receiver domain-containing protein [Rhodococcus sp. 14-2483-1-2]